MQIVVKRLLISALYAGLLSAGLRQAAAQPLNIQFQRFSTSQGLVSNTVLKVSQDESGYIVVHTPLGSSRFDGYNFQNSPSFTQNPYTTAKTALPAEWRKHHALPDSANAFHRDTLGRIWVATDHGLRVYQPAVDSTTRFLHQWDNRNSLSDNRIHCLFEDHSGNLWVGTEKGGLNKANLYAQPFRNFTYLDFPQKGGIITEGNVKVYSFSLYNDSLVWLGTNRGLYLYDRFRRQIAKGWGTISDPEKTRSIGTVLDIDQEPGGLTWLATRGGGVLSFDLKTETFRHRSGPIGRKEKTTGDDEVRTILWANPDSVWFGSYSGTFLIDTRTDETHYMIGGLVPRHCPPSASEKKSSYAPAWYSWELRRESDCIFYSCNASGLVRHNFCDRTAVVYETGDTTRPDGRRDLFTFHVDRRQYLWLATYGNGILRLDTASCEMKAFSVEDGLPDNYVYSLVEDETGKVWSSTNQGLFYTDPGKARIESFSFADGLAVTEFETGSFYRCPAIPGRKEELFFGGINGFVHFFPDEIRPRKPKPSILITAVTVLGNEIPIGPEPPRSLSVRSDSATLTFTYASTDYAHPRGNRFQYRMRGYEDSWTTSSTVNLARYTNLPPGDYTFEVLQPGMESSRKLHLDIRPRWYEILLVQVAAGIFVLLVVSWLVWRRIRFVRRREKDRRLVALAKVQQGLERVRWNSLLTLDFLGSIDYLITKQEFRTVERFIVGFDRMLRFTLQRSPERQFELRDEIKMLKEYIELESMRHPEQLSFQITVAACINQYAVEIPGGLLQPFVRDLIRQSSEAHQRLEIHFDVLGEALICTLDSHGTGTDDSNSTNLEDSEHRKAKISSPMAATLENLNQLNPYHVDYAYASLPLKDTSGNRIGTRILITIPIDPEALSAPPSSPLPRPVNKT